MGTLSKPLPVSQATAVTRSEPHKRMLFQRFVSSVLWPLKSIVKRILESAIRYRLHHLPLSQSAAEWWGELIVYNPAILVDEAIIRAVELDHGIQMEVGLVDAIERTLWVHRKWELQIQRALESLLKPGDHFLDLGSNIGYFTLLGSKLVGDEGLVVAVEPSQRALRKLTRHLWLNQCSNVVLATFAAGEEWRMDHLCLTNESNIGASSLAYPNSTIARTEPVWVAPIDQALRGIDLHPKVIKLDLEGYELACLRGATGLLEASRPWIICEVTDRFLRNFGASTNALVQFLEDRGYSPYSLNGFPDSVRPLDRSLLSNPDLQFDVLFSPVERIGEILQR